RAGQKPAHRAPERNADRRAAEAAAQNPRHELHRHPAARRRGKLIGDELDDGEQRENPRSERLTEERERRASHLQHSEARCPADRGRGSHGAQTRENPYQKRDDVDLDAHGYPRCYVARPRPNVMRRWFEPFVETARHPRARMYGGAESGRWPSLAWQSPV